MYSIQIFLFPSDNANPPKTMARKQKRKRSKAQDATPTLCKAQRPMRPRKPQCMAICAATGERCKNKGTSGFSKWELPKIVQQKLIFPAVTAILEGSEGGRAQIMDCCLFCDLHLTVLNTELVACGKDICKKLVLEQGVPLIWGTIWDNLGGAATGVPYPYDISVNLAQIQQDLDKNDEWD